MDFVLGFGVFILAWRWLRSVHLPRTWALGGAVLSTLVLYPLLISLLVTILRGVTSLPLWGVLALLAVLILVGAGGYWLGRMGFPLEPIPHERLRRG